MYTPRKSAWKDPGKHKPEPYVLQLVALADGRILRAWWTGSHWDGGKVKESDIIIKFKKYGD